MNGWVPGSDGCASTVDAASLNGVWAPRGTGWITSSDVSFAPGGGPTRIGRCACYQASPLAYRVHATLWANIRITSGWPEPRPVRGYGDITVTVPRQTGYASFDYVVADDNERAKLLAGELAMFTLSSAGSPRSVEPPGYVHAQFTGCHSPCHPVSQWESYIPDDDIVPPVVFTLPYTDTGPQVLSGGWDASLSGQCWWAYTTGAGYTTRIYLYPVVALGTYPGKLASDEIWSGTGYKHTTQALQEGTFIYVQDVASQHSPALPVYERGVFLPATHYRFLSGDSYQVTLPDGCLVSNPEESISGGLAGVWPLGSQLIIEVG